MSRMLRDSAHRLMGKAVEDIEKERFKKGIEKLDKVDRIAEKLKDREILYRSLLMRGFAKYRSEEMRGALADFSKSLDFQVALFSEDAENEEHQEAISSTTGIISDILSEMEEEDEVKNYIYSIKETLEKAYGVFEDLQKSGPENQEYLENFLKITENIGRCFALGELVDEAIPVMGKNFDLIEKLFKIRSAKVPEIEAGTKAEIEIGRESEAGIKSKGGFRARRKPGTEIEEETEDEIESGPSGLLSRLDESLMPIGQACVDFGYFEEARRLYERATNLYKEILNDQPENREAFHFLCQVLNYTGTTYMALENYEKAKESFEEAEGLLEKKALEDPDNIPVALLLANTQRIIGRVFLESAEDEEDEEEAIDYYSRAREGYRKILDNYPEIFELDESFAGFFDELADEFIELENPEGAEACYKDELEAFRHLHKKYPEDPKHILDISEVFRSLGDLFADEFETEKAKAYYEEEMETYEKLRGSRDYGANIEAYKAEVLNHIGELYAGYESGTALEYYEKVLNVFEKAFEEKPEDEYYSYCLIEVLNNLAVEYRSEEEYEKAVMYYERIIDVKTRSLANHPKELLLAPEIEDTYYELAGLYFEMEDEEKALKCHELVFERFEKRIAEYPDEEHIVLTAGKAYIFGINFFSQMETEAWEKYSDIARKYYEFTLKKLESLYAEHPENTSVLKMLVSFAERIGQIYRNANKLEETTREYEYAREKCETLYELSPDDPENGSRFFGILNNLGISYSIMGNREGAKECFEKAISINEGLLKSVPDDPDSLKKTLALFNNYAKLLREMGESEKAEEYHKKVEKIREKMEGEPEWEWDV